MTKDKGKQETWITSEKIQEKIVGMSAEIDQMRGRLTLYLQGVADQMGVPTGAAYDIRTGRFTMPEPPAPIPK